MRRAQWVALAVLLAAGCKKEEQKPAPPPPEPVALAPAGDAGPAAPAGPGVIRGVVDLTGEPPQMPVLKRGTDPVCAKTPMRDEAVLVKGGKLQNVFVRITQNLPGRVPSTPVVVDQTECMYRPRVQGAVDGQILEVKNTDPTLHNVHAYEGRGTMFNQAQPPSAPPIRKTASPVGIIKIGCDVHPWMLAYVIVCEHPYFAVTDADGKFEITGLPVGEYTLEAWHERFGTKAVPVSVKADAPAQVQITFASTDRGPQ